MQLVGYEPAISPFIVLLWEEEVYFEVELIDLGETIYSWAKHGIEKSWVNLCWDWVIYVDRTLIMWPFSYVSHIVWTRKKLNGITFSYFAPNS